MSARVTHRAAASSHRDAGISCRSVNLARGAQGGKVIPPGSLQHPASEGARGTLAVLPVVEQAGAGMGVTEGPGVEGTLQTSRASRLPQAGTPLTGCRMRPLPPPTRRSCHARTKPAGRAGGAAPHAPRPREMPRAASLRVSSMERIRNKSANRASQPELASTGLHGELLLPGDWGLCRAAGVTRCLQPPLENWNIFSCSGYDSF